MSRTRHKLRFGERLVGAFTVAAFAVSSGCATLAHRQSEDYDVQREGAQCGHPGTACPWLVGDALLLLPGIIPGVIAFIVDFSTGAWKHDSYYTEVHTASSKEDTEGNNGE